MALPVKYQFLPEYWFFGLDTLFEFVFFLITLIIAYYAYRAWKLTNKHNPKYFYTGFGLISASYLIKSVTNWVLHFRINQGTFTQDVQAFYLWIFAWGYYGHLLLMLAGLILLTFIALKNPNRRTRWLTFLLVIALSLQSEFKVANYYVSSTILLLIIFYHYLKVYLKCMDWRSLIPLGGFTALLTSRILFLFAEKHILFYVTGHLVELAAYSLLLLNLLLVVWCCGAKHGGKKKG
ncbi:MAG: hypothetical protein ACE5FT_02130 [Candidatus Nanoarchaeia archaeon]